MDTTVILAQPRVSRLRADAVYVDRSGSVRGTLDPGFSSARLARGPPRSVLFYWANSAHLSPIHVRDLAAQIHSFLLGK